MTVQQLYKIFLSSGKVSTDTRQDLNHTLFFALQGDNFDANEYALEAISKGADYAVVDKQDLPPHPKLIVVGNSLQTLQQLAKYHRQQLTIPILCIAGSNGKTTTKELTSAVLESEFKVFSTPGNFNNHIGVPLSLLQIDATTEVAVIEIGANHKGENDLLVNLVQPDFGVITNIGKDHMGEFGGYKGIIESYAEFIDYFNQRPDKILFFNKDDENIVKLTTTQNTLSFGLINKNQQAQFEAESTGKSWLLEARLLDDKETGITVKTHLFGHFNLYNLLAAFVVGRQLGIQDENTRKVLANFEPRNMRSQVTTWGSNTLILDAYNANPSSMIPALVDFAAIDHPLKSVFIGDMLELGQFSAAEHEHVVDYLATQKFNRIILVGKEFGKYKHKLKCVHFDSSEDAKAWVRKQNIQNELIFIKGSRGVKLEKIFQE